MSRKTIIKAWVRGDDGSLRETRINPQDYIDKLEERFPVPLEVSDLALLIPDFEDVWRLVPPRSNLPTYLDLPFFRLATRWFHEGLPEHFHLHVLPALKPHVTHDLVLRHLTVVINSETLPHEHKMEALTWLMAIWLEDIHWNHEHWIADGVWLRSHGDSRHEEEEHGH